MIAPRFPGQGHARTGMLHDLGRQAQAEPTLTEVSTTLGDEVLEMATAAARSCSVVAQLALHSAGVASARLLAGHGVRVDGTTTRGGS